MKNILLVVVLFLGIATGIKAQYTGPGSEIKLSTIEQVKKDAMKLDRKDALVRIKGTIAEQLNDEDFIFQDKTGKIQIEIDDKFMPDFPFDENTEVIITAEVDYDLLNGTELEVEKIIEKAVEAPAEK